jgi:hypothetical protein
MANVTVSPGRAGLVEIEIRIENADEQPLRAKAVSVTLGNSEKGFEVTTDAEQISNDQWRADVCAGFGPLVSRTRHHDLSIPTRSTSYRRS